MTTYVYGMRLRGFSPGAQPRDGLLGREDIKTNKYYDIIAYGRELSAEEQEHYSLDYLYSRVD